MRTLEEIESLLGQSIADYMQNQKIPGIAVGIVLDGEIAYTKGFGVKNADTKEPVTAEAMFHSASISKTFVATSLMQLRERGKISLDEPVTAYLPYFKLKDERYRKITLKQMLSHISGMPDVYDYQWTEPQYGDEALEDYVKSIYDHELLWEPGEAYAYSNLAYEVLGDVIAKASGMSFEAYVKQNILEPLGMKSSSFLIREVPEEMLTSPHVLDISSGYRARVNEFYPYNRIHAPSSTLCSNVKELCRYAIANLNKGSLGTYQMLKPESYEMMWQPYKAVNRPATSIGLSWFLKQYKGESLVFHTGGDTGYTSNLVLIPEKSAALVFYCNCDYINLNLIIEHILDVILGFEVQSLSLSIVPEIVRAIAERGLEAAEASFDEIRRSYRNKYYISEDELNSLAYNYLKLEKPDTAIAVLNMAVSELPEASNLYDSLGEMYLEAGNRDKAVESYRKALELNPQSASSITALKNIEADI